MIYFYGFIIFKDVYQGIVYIKAASCLHWWWLLTIDVASRHSKGILNYIKYHEGPLRQSDCSNPHYCTNICYFLVKLYVKHIDMVFHISHPDDIVTSTIQIVSNAGDVFLEKIVLCHIVCLHVEYNASCGNKILLNHLSLFHRCCTMGLHDLAGLV